MCERESERVREIVGEIYRARGRDRDIERWTNKESQRDRARVKDSDGEIKRIWETNRNSARWDKYHLKQISSTEREPKFLH